MTSYLKYKQQMAVLDADGDIETWITVKGNHIPIMKGQSKEDAVKAFIEKKSGKESAQRESKPTSIGEATKKVVKQAGENKAIREAGTGKKESAPKTVAQIKKAAANLESSAAYHYERADRLSEMIKTREKEMENPDITPVMRKSIEKSIGELQLAISKHWVEASKIEKSEREKKKTDK